MNVIDVSIRLEHAGGQVIPYSGRGMNGRSCLGVTGSEAEVRSCVAETIKAAHDQLTGEHGSAQFDELVDHLVVTARTDQLGHGVVTYFPTLPTE